MWGGRRYLVEVEPETPVTIDIMMALGLDVASNADVIIDLTGMRYLKNRSSGRYWPDTLDTVVYHNGNAREVTPEELQDAVDELHRNR